LIAKRNASSTVVGTANLWLTAHTSDAGASPPRRAVPMSGTGWSLPPVVVLVRGTGASLARIGTSQAGWIAGALGKP
jgi:hypothetical protein